MADSILSDEFSSSPYWWDAAPPEADLSALPRQVDTVVVGSGYCGLSAATELARAGQTVVVLDSDLLGSGASTRSHGMVSSGQKLVLTGAFKSTKDDQLARMLAESLSSFDYLIKIIDDENLDVDLALTGRYFGAHSKGHLERLYANGDLLARHTGATVHRIDRAGQKELIGTDVYLGGILVDDYGGLDPAKLHREMRRRAREAGAQLRSHAAYLGQENDNGAKIVKTARGRIRARTVVIGTNGYTGSATPQLQKKTVPVRAYLIATEQIPSQIMKEINPGSRIITDSRRNLYAMRPSPDGTRVIFGNRPGVFEHDPESAARILHSKMCEIWPQLRPYKITHSWGGNVCMTYDKQPHMGENPDGYYALGCNGNGVALMTYLGYSAARKILKQQNRMNAFEENAFRSIPLYNGNPWFVPTVGAWYKLRDHLDR